MTTLAVSQINALESEIIPNLGTPISISNHSKAGASRETRTPDPLITNQMLYRLSYRGTPKIYRLLKKFQLLSFLMILSKQSAVTDLDLW